ncbi:MAG: hypothetical protein ACFB4I_16045 [Cyanophyceae cyanobacterium]
MYYYYLPEPPYILLVVGLLAAIASGAAFEATLKQKVQEWAKSPYDPAIDKLKSLELRVPFLGICGGVCVFLAAGLEVFSIVRWLSYAVSLPLTLLIGYLVWSQLGKLLKLLHQGGSQAIDLDAFE